uniref:Uncharacterized protein n=1 Tax=Oryza sativa subsp. japonica TaxID=39947 RepID=Q6EQJ3_ORYSJ|nr:hypothetical protein [Oryza sativa Japonica Group]BAD29077.1 hypothetical protein [Oryza sativa Japonica Group]
MAISPAGPGPLRGPTPTGAGAGPIFDPRAAARARGRLAGSPLDLALSASPAPASRQATISSPLLSSLPSGVRRLELVLSLRSQRRRHTGRRHGGPAAAHRRGGEATPAARARPAAHRAAAAAHRARPAARLQHITKSERYCSISNTPNVPCDL